VGDEKMEKYNKVYFSLWLLFSAVTLSFMFVFVVNELGEILDDVALSFFLLFFTSEVIGFMLASLTIDRISWAYYVHAFFASMNRRTILHLSF
jgi:hypothetical protein